MLRCLGRCPNGVPIALAYTALKSLSYSPEFRTRDGDRVRLDTFEDLVTCWLVFVRRDYETPGGARRSLTPGPTSARSASTPRRSLPGRGSSPSNRRRGRAILEANIAASGRHGRIETRGWSLAGTDGVRYFDNRPAVPSQFRAFLDDGQFRRVLDSGIPSDGTSIETLTLQTLMDREGIDRFGLLKLDVEGSEHEVIRETPLDVLRRVDHIALEYHPPHANHKLFEGLREAGFSMASHDPAPGRYGVARFTRDDTGDGSPVGGRGVA